MTGTTPESISPSGANSGSEDGSGAESMSEHPPIDIEILGDAEEITEDIQALAEDHAESAPMAEQESVSITDPRHDRYFTLGLISWWDREKIKNATVLVIGAGALGNEVLKNLALMGVGHIIIVDLDTIEDSNLSRSILFREADNGKLKAEVAASAVKEINSDVKTKWINADVTWEIGLGLFRRVDVVIGCLDNQQARLALSQACWKTGKHFVDGAIDVMTGEARVYLGGNGACFECGLSMMQWEEIDRATSCMGLARASVQAGKIPTTPTVSSLIAAVQAQEAMKIINGLPVQPGRGLVFNGHVNHVHKVTYPIKHECKHGCVYNDPPPAPADLEQWEQGRAAHTTARELLEFGRKKLGEEVVLQLDREFVVALQGADPNDRVEVLKPFDQLTEEDARNPETDERRAPEMVHTITGAEPYADLPLSCYGIPPLHVVALKKSTAGEFVYVELTGDKDEVFNFS